MSSPAKLGRPAIYQDIIQLPDGMIGQIVDGVLYTSPRPAGKHAFAAMKVSSAIDTFFGSKKSGGPGGWVFLFEPELLCGSSDILVPDIAGWRVAKLSDDELAELSTNKISVTPDWVCEIISPSSIRMDRVLKPKKYAEVEIDYYWLIDPDQKTLEVRRLVEKKWIVVQTFEGDERVRAEPFTEFDLELGTLWGPVRH